ncbi:MAG: carboxypeptidase regulatory-like domain-containing protein [Burkholderiales bacterium]|nr:carboxypeptidase regulatory-like domain-containing protein [Burkholderiales bacterium]
MNRTSFVVLALVSPIALAGGIARAQPSEQPARSNASQSAAGVAFTSGGVGIAAREQLAAHASQYNLKLVFAYAPEGEYLAAVQVDIADQRGTTVLSTLTEGPWLMAKLPAGTYTLKARFGGVTRTQQIHAGPGMQRIVVRFPASVEHRLAGATPDRTRASVASR